LMVEVIARLEAYASHLRSRGKLLQVLAVKHCIKILRQKFS
jgi:hypothetical protein